MPLFMCSACHCVENTALLNYWALRIRAENAEADRDRLRAALIGLVGASTRAELEQMEMALRSMPVVASDLTVTIDAIHALLATEVGPHGGRKEPEPHE